MLSDCIEANPDGSGSLDLARYYRKMLEYMVDDASFDFKNIATLLRGLNSESGDWLESMVPEPSTGGLTEDEEGKSDKQSEDENDTTTKA